MARCLVTGHKGYIGSRLFERLQELGHEVMGIDLQEEFPKDIRDFFNEDFGSEVYPAYWNFKPEYVFRYFTPEFLRFSYRFIVNLLKFLAHNK